MTRVKICGNTNPEDAKLAIELGADYLGFIFAESKRKISLATANRIVASVPHFHHFVGVFLNQPRDYVERIAGELALPYLQFHGDETARYCKYFMDKNYRVIKTFRIKDEMSLRRIDEYNVSNFLFDTYDKDQFGGTGVAFDWNLISDRPFIHEKLFLAGGLNIRNVQNAIRSVAPYAVDVASGVEVEPGKKDPQLLETFMTLVKKGGGAGAAAKSVHT
ncbi:MAG: hypothetical protein A2Z83_05365 [Omnitrophica bacterium GWA2_52_8]|nr:MAG: hypothetical protein A2Z83_05365 [Omnitrophica bacterium GWA2_52_8]